MAANTILRPHIRRQVEPSHLRSPQCRLRADQFHAGQHIESQADLQPGDLVFFEDSTGYIHHVGMYIGDGKFLHAPHTGDVVKISSMTGWYASTYVGARRI